MMESGDSPVKVLDEKNESEASSSESEEEVSNGKLQELHSIHEAFAKEIMNSMKQFFDPHEESNWTFKSFGFPCSNIVRGILTLSYVFRIDYRRIYLSTRHHLIHAEKFLEFCSVIKVEQSTLYFFNFMKRISLIFEISMYLHREGYDYFDIAVNSVADYQDLLYFESAGGFPKLSKIATLIVDVSANLQALVNNEHPQTQKLLTFPETLLNLEAKYRTSSDTKLLASLSLLKAINANFYSGLLGFTDKEVLPFLILRFMLEGRPPSFMIPESRSDDNDHGFDKAEVGILMYLHKCMVPEILTGFAFRYSERDQTPEPVVSERNSVSEDEGSSICDTSANSEEESSNSSFIHSHNSDPFKEEKEDFYRNLCKTKMLYLSEKKYLYMLITEMKAFSEKEESHLFQIINAIPEEEEFDWHGLYELIPDSLEDEKGTIDLIRSLNAAPDSSGAITEEFIKLICGILAISSDEISLPMEDSEILEWSEEEKAYLIESIRSSPDSPGDGKIELIRMICDLYDPEDDP